MRTHLRRNLVAIAISVLGGFGMLIAIAWSPTATALIQPAVADDGDDSNDGDDDDRDDSQAPAGGVATGAGGQTDDDDNGDDDRDDSQAPAGGVATGAGGAADIVSSNTPASEQGSESRLPGAVALVAVVGVGALAAGRLALGRLAARQH